MTDRAGRGALAVTLVGGVLILAGCGRPGVLSRTSVDACYRAIPPAAAAVHDGKARMLGVHRVPADRVVDKLSPTGHQRLENDTTVCAVAFSGSFAAGQVTSAQPGVTGRYAVVLVSERRLDLIESFVLDRLPKALGSRLT